MSYDFYMTKFLRAQNYKKFNMATPFFQSTKKSFQLTKNTSLFTEQFAYNFPQKTSP